MTGAVRALLAGLIDYAGLFPPAGLAMDRAVANFAAYRRRPDAWVLARFVVPARRLGEFTAALAALPPAARGSMPWELTVLLADPAADLALAARLPADGPAVIRSYETRADTPERVRSLRAAVPAGTELYLELPLAGDLASLMESLRECGARAKIRMGGVRAADIPAPDAVLAFLQPAARLRVPFKATAGLHHPVRGPAPLSYEPGSARATMYGYVNLFLAAAALWQGRAPDEVRRLLTLEDRDALRLGEEGITWQGTSVSADAIDRARHQFALAIGSCSFTEPVEEIEALGAHLAEA